MGKILGKNEILNINEFKKRGKFIYWNNNIGLIIDILYKGKEYKVRLAGYNKQKGKIIVEYKGVEYLFATQHFLNLEIGTMFITKTLFSEEILKTTFEIDYNRCESELGLSKNEILLLSYKSDKYLYFKCKNCGSEISKEMKCGNIFKHPKHPSCPICGDSISYAEKMFNCAMKTIDKNPVKTRFKWSVGKEYDAYFKDINIIIELHGEQHYISKQKYRGRTLIEEQENDKIKMKLAIDNKISDYIVIDCRKSEFNFIKQNIINSRLGNYININNIKWEEVYKEMQKSIVLAVCNEWNKLDPKIKTPESLVGVFGIKDSTTIRKYLKTGTELKVCEYNKRISNNNKGFKISKIKSKQYECILNGKYYDFTGQREICEYFGLGRSSVSQLIKNKEKYIPKYKRLIHLQGLMIRKKEIPHNNINTLND